MRYAVTLERGGGVVWDRISRESVTRPATAQEAQEAVKEWNARCVVKPVDPPIRVDGWTPAGEVTLWLKAEDGWWGQVHFCSLNCRPPFAGRPSLGSRL